MKRSVFGYVATLMISLTACASPPPPAPTTPLKTVSLDSTDQLVAGQTVYVPIYSQIYMWQQSQTIDLTATLSVRNTDLTHAMIVASVEYYNDAGELVRSYLEQPIELEPLASTSFVVEQEDASGGVGAAFVVEWVARQAVSTPVIESVMLNASGNQGISLISPGRVIRDRTSSPPTPN
ncbi:DUF3124 domain-containing protein [Thermocoleostomius sinensis]|jgi:hypothetical protein|uniref:DUF3124 domain-containing protein n=1 Tax=Thermocoleostomius sinensis A174 TaxID=2016057 RepID=A0A9E8ZDV6_9CYAN|nr:DUF3124 domain-containing protein [Thermocoleostomius sinensis]WAL60027.1 DUF3124 domain-containing protein [Thermocoleostomius sinensis A174]